MFEGLMQTLNEHVKEMFPRHVVKCPYCEKDHILPLPPMAHGDEKSAFFECEWEGCQKTFIIQHTCKIEVSTSKCEFSEAKPPLVFTDEEGGKDLQ